MVFERGAEADDASALVCPVDGAAMQRVPVGRTHVDRCGSCGGTWFDTTELTRIMGDATIEAHASRIPVNAEESLFACPRCQGRCVEGSVDDVKVDTCTRCRGLWLDRGELTDAKRAIRDHRREEAKSGGFRAFLDRI